MKLKVSTIEWIYHRDSNVILSYMESICGNLKTLVVYGL